MHTGTYRRGDRVIYRICHTVFLECSQPASIAGSVRQHIHHGFTWVSAEWSTSSTLRMRGLGRPRHTPLDQPGANSHTNTVPTSTQLSLCHCGTNIQDGQHNHQQQLPRAAPKTATPRPASQSNSAPLQQKQGTLQLLQLCKPQDHSCGASRRRQQQLWRCFHQPTAIINTTH